MEDWSPKRGCNLNSIEYFSKTNKQLDDNENVLKPKEILTKKLNFKMGVSRILYLLAISTQEKSHEGKCVENYSQVEIISLVLLFLFQ